MLEMLSDPAVWERFFEYKTSLACDKGCERDLRRFIDEKRYLSVCERIESGASFPLPKRAEISKLGSKKKRVVYTYPEPENTVLKLLTHLLLRKYDALFSDGLYSFRPGRSAKDAIRRLMHTPGVVGACAYKVDISNYFNSVEPERFLPLLRDALSDDAELFAFLSALLSEKEVRFLGKTVVDEKGIMAGTPLASFYANLYLKELDAHFADEGVPYARYSDDIIVFAPTRCAAEEHAEYIRAFLLGRGLCVNPDKECFFAKEDGFVFLGFSVSAGGKVDIAPATLQKLKNKMRRKTRALDRWRKRSGLPGEKAAAAFIRVFNRKLLEGPLDNELSWSYWFFSVINTTESLYEIDRYAQDCLRFLISGKRTKARFNARYSDLKALGYRSLVNAYYSHKNAEKDGLRDGV